MKWKSGWYLAAIAAIGLLFGSAGSTQHAPDPAAHDGAVSAMWVASLRHIAASRPSAATALLYLHTEEKTSGTLLLEAVPTAESVGTLVDIKDGSSAGWAGGAMRRNPYSAATVFVEVRWTVGRVNDGVFLLTTRAQLVRGDGSALVPPHPVEPPTTIMVSGGLLHLLPDSQQL